MADVVRARLRVYGVVQGVGYSILSEGPPRPSTWRDLSGTAPTERRGGAEGEKAAVNALMEELRVGPTYASVERVDAAWEEPAGDLAGFTYSF